MKHFFFNLIGVEWGVTNYDEINFAGWVGPSPMKP